MGPPISESNLRHPAGRFVKFRWQNPSARPRWSFGETVQIVDYDKDLNYRSMEAVPKDHARTHWCRLISEGWTITAQMGV